MRPLPRVLAFADDRIGALEDLGVRAAAIAAAGPAIGLVARRPHGTTDDLAGLAQRFASLAGPPMASMWVSGRMDVAMAVGADGMIARAGDLPLDELRRISRVTPAGAVPRAVAPAILRSVHSEPEAASALADGADALVLGSIWPSATHPQRGPVGVGLLERVAGLGVPVYAIGGVSPERAREAREAGAWGVAAIGAVWDAVDPYRAALALLSPWEE